MAFEDAGWLLGEIEELQDSLKANELTGYYLTSSSETLASKSYTMARNSSDLISVGNIISKYPGVVTFSVKITNNGSTSFTSKLVLKNAQGTEIELGVSNQSQGASTTKTETIFLESNSPWEILASNWTNVSGSITPRTTFAWSIQGTVNKFENPVMLL